MICGKCKKFSTKSIGVLSSHWKYGCTKEIWSQIVVARQEGSDAKTDKLIRKAFGIHRPMSEEAKEKLRKHNAEHREDIKMKRKFQRQSQQRHQKPQ